LEEGEGAAAELLRSKEYLGLTLHCFVCTLLVVQGGGEVALAILTLIFQQMDVVPDLDIQNNMSRKKYWREEEAISVLKFVANPWTNAPSSK